jgi:predicted membrane protein
MKKKVLLFACCIFISGLVSAQEFKLAKSTGKLIIKDVNHVTIEGSTGNEIIFTSLDGARDKDDRAKGLRAVSNMGLEDNTGVGLAVLDKGTTYEVYQLKKMDGPRVKISVPKGVIIYLSHSSPYGEDVRLKNIEGEIETSTVHNGIHLENVTGPMTIKTVHGEIEADFSAGIKSPIILSSQHGLVDVTLPAAVKATMSMKTNFGEIFVDPAFKLEVDNSGDMVKYSSNKVSGKINGGGIDIQLNSTHSNIYLRKK